jgi:chromosomal replication initiator protein
VDILEVRRRIMEGSAEKIWEEALALIRKNLTEQSFETWFRPTRGAGLSDNTLTVDVPYGFFRDWLKEHYLSLIEKTLEETTKEKLRIDFFVSSSKGRSGEEPQPLVSPVGGQEEEEVEKLDRGLFLNPKYVFESFVVGASNRFAHAASLAVAEAPSNAYNPLFIYGGVGLGKTHLMQAIGHFTKKGLSRARVVYVSSEKFTNDLIESLQRGHDKILEFRNKYRSIDVLLVDDIHFLANKERTQEEFFYTFNELYNNQKQIVISSDRPPKEIPSLEERLISRFAWGLVADIQPPDLETRVAILRKKGELEHLRVSDEVNFFIANQIKSNIRELEGALIRVVAFASLAGEEVTIDLTKTVLKDFLPQEKERIVSTDLIQKIVAEYFGLQISDMKIKRRINAIAFPRQIAMYLVRELTDLSLPEIGKGFGGRDHTTVLHAYNKIKKRVEKDPEFKKTAQELIFKITR